MNQTGFYLEKMIFNNLLPITSFIKVTIVGANSTGFSSDDCRFWGLAIYDLDRFEKLRNSYDTPVAAIEGLYPLFLMCKQIYATHLELEVPVPAQYYSLSNSITLVLYSYVSETYTFSVNIKVDATHCSGGVFYCGIDLEARQEFKIVWPKPYISDIPAFVYGDLPLSQITDNDIYGECEIDTHDKFVSIEVQLHGVRLCISRHDKSIINTLSLFRDVSCVVMQYFPIFEGDRADICSTAMKVFSKPELNYKPTVFNITTTAWVQTSINSPNVTVTQTSASNNFAQIYPTSSVFQAIISIVDYPIQIGHFGPNFTWNDLNILVTEGQANHYTQNRHHYLPTSVFINKKELADYTYGISSAMICDPFLQLEGSDLKWDHFNNIMNNVSIMSLHTNDSEAHIQLDIHYATPVPTQYFEILQLFMYVNYHEHHIIYLKRFTTFRIISLVTFVYRYITVRKLPPGKFGLALDINPFVPLMEVITYKDYHDTFNYGLKDYFVIWQSRRISWKDANQTCASIGGRIIKGATQEDIAFVEKLILGIQFGSDVPPLPSPVRFHPHTGVFIDQVCIMYSLSSPFT